MIIGKNSINIFGKNCASRTSDLDRGRLPTLFDLESANTTACNINTHFISSSLKKLCCFGCLLFG
jgi:hypothetical protein